MADRWLFVGGGIETCRTITGLAAVSTSTSSRRAAYSDHTVNTDSVTKVAYDFVGSTGSPDSATSGEKLYAHAVLYPSIGTTTDKNILELHDSSGYPWVALRCYGVNQGLALYYNSGTGPSPVWTQIPGTSAVVAIAAKTYDVWVTIGSPHTVGWAYDGAQVGEGTFTQAGLTNISAVAFSGINGATSISEVMASVGIPTIAGSVFYGKPSAAGSNSGWTGLFSAIDDADLGDADSISSATSGQRSTFAYSNMPTLTASDAVGDVFLWTRARNSGAVPNNIAPVRRSSGGVDNVGSTFSGIATAYKSFLTRYSGLTEAEYNASEFGVESAT